MSASKRPACRATTKAGRPCRNQARPGTDRCGIHATDATPEKEWMRNFLRLYRDRQTVTEAAKAAGIDRATAYRAKQRDEWFALAWADVEREVTEELEAEARRRAKDGSDTLLIFLLKARRPEMYRENVKIEHAGGIEKRVTVDLSKLDTDELEQLERIAQKIEA